MKLLNLPLDDFYLNVEIRDVLTSNGFQRRHVLPLGEKLIGIPNNVVFESDNGFLDITDESVFTSSVFELDDTCHFPTIRFKDKSMFNGKNILFTGVTTQEIGFDLTKQVNLLVDRLSDLQDIQLLAGGALYKEDGTTEINLVIVLPVRVDYKINDVVFSSSSGNLKTDVSPNKVAIEVGSLIKDI